MGSHANWQINAGVRLEANYGWEIKTENVCAMRHRLMEYHNHMRKTGC